MFGFGNREEKLKERYSQLMQEVYELSTVNRKKSDLKRAEAEKISDALEKLRTKNA